MPTYINAKSVNIKTTIFFNNRNIISVNCNNVPWTNNTMVRAFHNCKNLTSISNLNDSVINMSGTFNSCNNLITPPTIPNSVTDMSNTFYRCYNLTSIPTIPNGVTNLTNAFQGCHNMISVVNIPDSVVDLSHTFQYCNSLTTVTNISNSVTNMVNAFMGCTNLEFFPNTIPNSVIDASGFIHGCPKLFNKNKYPTIPSSVQKLEYMFAKMTDTASTVPQWCLDKWNNCSANVKTSMAGMFTNWTNLKTMPTIPSGVTSIYYAFYYCKNLTTLSTIPEGVTNMGGTFGYCQNLTSAPTIPNGVTNLSGAFQFCNNMTSAPTIPNSVTILSSTFYGCTKLGGNIYIYSNNIISCMMCFYSTTKTKNVYIPFKYENGVYTKTYNSFISSGYDTAGTNCGVYLKDTGTH